MCGIAGIVSFQDRPVDLDLLQEMTDRQAHRGPDGEGFLLSWLESGGVCPAPGARTRHLDARAPGRRAVRHRRPAVLGIFCPGPPATKAVRSACWCPITRC